MRKLIIIVFSFLFLVIAARIGVQVMGRGDPPAGDDLVILVESLPETLDPARNTSFEKALPVTAVYEGLVRLNPRTLQPEACLADSWSVSDDGRRWTFHLKQGLVFSDGSPCDAEAVKASMARSMVLKDTQPYCSFLFSPVSSIEAEGKYTVTFLLKYPYAPFLKNLALPFAAPVVSPGSVSRHGNDFWLHPSGTGPYRLAQYGRDEIVLLANPLYRSGPASVERVVIRPVPDSGVRADHLLGGKADIILSPGRQKLDIIKARNFKTISVPGIDVSFIGFYTDRPPFSNINLRRAVAFALDRERITTVTFKGDGVPAAGIVPPPASAGAREGYPRYSQEQVRRLLAREGYPSGIGVNLITYRDSRKYCPPGGTALAEEIKNQLEPAGIRVTIQSRPWNEHKEAMAAKEGDFYLYGWTGDSGDADNFLYTLLASSQAGNGLNASGFSDGRLDVFLHTARRVSDRESREYLYSQAESIVMEEVPVAALNHSLASAAFSPGVENVVLSGFGLIDLYPVKKHTGH